MREILMHKTGPDDRQPRVYAVGEPGAGGAATSYVMRYPHKAGISGEANINIEFLTVDRAGVTNEALLAILIDRLEGFQAGPFACEENADALRYCDAALGSLKCRTAGRQQRGVENTLNP